jgi:streptogramin lyase
MTKKVFLLATVLLVSGLTGFARPELLVVSGGGPSRPAVVRLDAQTGTILERVAASQESVRGVAVDAAGEVLVSGNTLGAGEITKLGFGAPGVAHPAFTLPGNLKIGPDGHIYVLSAAAFNGAFRGQVLKFDGRNGALLGGFAGPEESGSTWTDLAFGPDGLLYVADQTLGIMRFEPETGEFLGVFVPGGRSGPQSASALAFGPDGHLYVADRDASSVMRFDGQTGRFIDDFISSQSGGLKGPASLVFGDNQQLFVASAENHSILRYNSKTGAFTGTVVSANPQLQTPTRLVFASLP